ARSASEAANARCPQGRRRHRSCRISVPLPRGVIGPRAGAGHASRRGGRYGGAGHGLLRSGRKPTGRGTTRGEALQPAGDAGERVGAGAAPVGPRLLELVDRGVRMLGLVRASTLPRAQWLWPSSWWGNGDRGPVGSWQMNRNSPYLGQELIAFSAVYACINVI